MTAHELARLLLDGPDINVVVMPVPNVTRDISSIDEIKTGSYPQPSWADKPSTKTDVLVFTLSEETLNEDEEFTFSEEEM